MEIVKIWRSISVIIERTFKTFVCVVQKFSQIQLKTLNILSCIQRDRITVVRHKFLSMASKFLKEDLYDKK